MYIPNPNNRGNFIGVKIEPLKFRRSKSNNYETLEGKMTFMPLRKY
jgi:hypothetical protein